MIVCKDTIYTIYMLEDHNHDRYVGFTSDYRTRLAAHKRQRDILNDTILYQTKEMEHAYDMEEYFINEFDTYHNGLNKTPDGKGICSDFKSSTGFKFTENSKRKMSISAKARVARDGLPKIEYTDSYRKRLSNIQSGIVTYSKLTPAIILEIKKLYLLRPYVNVNGNLKRNSALNTFCSLMGSKYKVSNSCIRNIIECTSYTSKSRLNKNTKFTFADAERIRKLYRSYDFTNIMNSRIKRPYDRVFSEVYAKRFNITNIMMYNIITGKSAKNIKANIDKRILTPNGYERFEGIIKNKYSKYMKVIFDDNTNLTCSYNHRLLTMHGVYKKPLELTDNDMIVSNNGGIRVREIIEYKEQIFLYDIINAGDFHCYYTNGVVSHNCHFISSSGTLINSTILEDIPPQAPIKVYQGLKLFDSIKRKRLAFSVDVGAGVGNDYSTIQIFDIETLIQIGEFQDNTLTSSEFTKKIIYLLEFLFKEGANEIYYTVEANAIGQGVISLLNVSNNPVLDKAYRIIEHKQSKHGGMLTTTKSKMKGCMKLKDLVEKGHMTLKSKSLLSELKLFVRAGSTFKAEVGMTDDLVMALVVLVNMLAEVASYEASVYDALNAIDDFDSDDDYSAPLPISF